MSFKTIATVVAAFLLTACNPPQGAVRDKGPPDFTGVWTLAVDQSALRPLDGAEIPLSDWGKETYEHNKAALAKGDLSVDLTRKQCSAPGAVRLLTMRYPVEFFQRPHQLTILYQWNHLYRLVNLSAKLTGPYPMANGTSNGTWDGDTLVVQTTDLTDNTLLDSTGLPHSDQTTLTERIKMLSPDRLEVLLTITDAKAFTKPWSARFEYERTKAKGIEEDTCLDRLDKGEAPL